MEVERGVRVREVLRRVLWGSLVGSCFFTWYFLILIRRGLLDGRRSSFRLY